MSGDQDTRAWRYEVHESHEPMPPDGNWETWWDWSILDGPDDPDDLVLSGQVDTDDPTDLLAGICERHNAALAAHPETPADDPAEKAALRAFRAEVARIMRGHTSAPPLVGGWSSGSDRRCDAIAALLREDGDR